MRQVFGWWSCHELVQHQLFCSATGMGLGSESRTDSTLRTPGINNFDFAVFKRTTIHERVGLEFRTEFFNLFNHPEFSMPGQDVDSFTFGRIMETVNNPRLIQLALKLRF
jgi:hypothetical protein